MDIVALRKLIELYHGYSFVNVGCVFAFFDRQEDMVTAIVLAGVDDLYSEFQMNGTQVTFF
jgi:hypothetical protein